MAAYSGETTTSAGGGWDTGTYVSNRNKKASRANFDKWIYLNPRQEQKEGVSPIIAPNLGETLPENWKGTL